MDTDIRLHLVATPIGNLEDATFRSVRIFREADAIACEDTRRTGKLLSFYEIPRPRFFFSYREQMEQRSAERVLHLVTSGQRVAVCSDSGYPGISDPGYRLLSLAAEHEIPYEVIPGASSVPVALLLSGLSTASYTFKGFAPRKTGARVRFFAADLDQPHTLVVFESPFRIGACLRDALSALGDRRAAVCLELTKRFERVERGYLSELAERFADRAVKGEATLVVAGANPKFIRSYSP